MPQETLLLYIIMPAYIFVTFIMGAVYLNLKKKDNIILLSILGVSLGTEIFSAILKNFNLVYSISFILHHGLWLFLLIRKIMVKKAVIIILSTFFTVGITNLFFFEGLYEVNNYTFVIGAFIYIVIFIYESFNQLKKENFSFFISNRYLLIFSPILFFFGFSFMFAFKNQLLLYVLVIGNLGLYHFIGFFVNLAYYSLVNSYIYKDKKLKDGGKR